MRGNGTTKHRLSKCAKTNEHTNMSQKPAVLGDLEIEKKLFRFFGRGKNDGTLFLFGEGFHIF